MDNLIDKLIQAVPRKLVGGLTAMGIIGYYAQQGVDWKVLGMMSVLGLAAIASHWWLEYKCPKDKVEK